MIDISEHNLRLVPESQIDFQKLNRIQDLESENRALKTGLVLISTAVVLITGIFLIDQYSKNKDS